MTISTSIYFIDPTCPKAFVYDDLVTKAIAGTEAATLRIAQSLSNLGFRVRIFQNSREKSTTDTYGIEYKPLCELSSDDRPSHVVLIRKRRWLSKIDSLFPDAKKFFWLHEFVHRSMLLSRLRLRNWTVLAVSQTQATQIKNVSSNSLLDSVIGKLLIKTVYNSVCMDEFDPKILRQPPDSELKLVFFSSPHKGLDQVLRVFAHIKKKLSNAKLYIANPGYLDSKHTLPDGVVSLGALSKGELYAHIASAFCVFYPQSSFAETFGLIYVEANALGTPVLCADIGAAREILSNPDTQIVTPPTEIAFLKRLESWIKNGRPQFKARSFSIDEITQTWLDTLGLE